MPSTLMMGAIIALASFLALTASRAQDLPPQITEFVAINAASLTDGDGITPDWIELHNPNPSLLDISGYHLTDDPEVPDRYTFPAGTSIPGGEYLVVFASGRVELDYIDAAGNLHTNFSLDGAGEYLALNAPDNSVLQSFTPEFPLQFEDVSYGVSTASPPSTLIAAEADCSWFVPASDLGSSWQTPSFDDATWNPANTGIGYGYDNTLIGTDGDTRNAMWFISASVYLRVPFEILDPASIESLTLAMKYEDGFVAYLNGARVAASNAPDEASLTFTSTATAEQPNAQASQAELFAIPTASLVAGTNILAIHGLNFSASGTNSSDFLALPELTATSTNSVGTFGYFTDPTPGALNDTTQLLGFVADTKFSVDRGYFTAPFDLTLSTATPGATIIFTTDGTPPSETNGTIYTAPLTISSTTTLRALAIKDGFHPTNVDTQTYLFVANILRQRRPNSYPTTWGGASADYEMDRSIVTHPAYANEFEAAFDALPTLSLVFDPDALFHPSTGVYQRPGEDGIAWERPLSAEFFVPDQSEPGFQIDAGIRIQGGSSRNTDTPKHSLSLRFRADYGAEKLRYPLFANSPGGSSAVERFDLLQLRPEYNFGWMHRHWYQALYSLYGRDQWASDLFIAMGQNGSHGRWVHLFLNGLYWGLYDLHERPDADHMANYFGGTDDDYDTVNSSVATNGDLTAYNTMMNIAYGAIENANTYRAIQNYLNIDAFIDYMILNAYVGNRDWDGHNWRAARKREGRAGYLFFPWDTEFAVSHVPGGVFNPPPDFFSTTLNTNVTGKNGNRRPTGLQQRLERNAEYRLRYADHMRAHFFNDGPLTPDRAAAIWTARSASMTTAIVAESARWGDFRRDVNPGRWSSAQFDLYTRDDHYLPIHAWLLDTYIPQRSALVFDQLRARNLYPATDAPDFSQHGGTVPRGFLLQIDAPDTIHYTIDGSDPRLAGGAISPAATTLVPGSQITLNQSTQIQARTRAANGEWSALTKAFYTISATDLRITEIMYHPHPEPRAEFLELTNGGAFPVSLTGLHFSDGITFDFDQHSALLSLAPGERLLIVRDLLSFQGVYGNVHDGIIAGVFQEDTALSNDGETLTISDANDELVLTLTYNDVAPWPTAPDGTGHSLVATGGDFTTPQAWRPSATPGGNPGTSDSTPYLGGSLLDYALAGPLQISSTPVGIALTYSIPLTADDATITIQHSPDLSLWSDAPTSLLRQELNPESTHSITVRLQPDGPIGFVRLVVGLRSQSP